MKISDFINLEATKETLIFIRGTHDGRGAPTKLEHHKKEGTAMLNELLREYFENDVKPRYEKCESIQDISKVMPDSMPDNIREACVSFIESQDDLNIVEQTYFLLDLIHACRAAASNITRQMSLHYASLLDEKSEGGRILGMNGQPFNKKKK